MPSTRTWLKVMLWAIGFGAAMGVLAVLFAAHFFVYRAMGTCFLVAGAALLMMAVARFADHEATRSAAILGMWLVIAEFALAIGLVWNIDDALDLVFGLTSYRFEYAMWAMMGWLFLVGVPSMAFLRLLRTDHSRLAGMVGLALAAVTLAMWMINTGISTFSAVRGPWDHRHAWMQAGFWVGTMGLLIVGNLAGVPKLRDRPWRWLGVGCAIAAAAMAITGTYLDVSSEPGEKITFGLISIAVLTCFANLLLCVPLRPQHRWLVYATNASAAVTIALLNIIVIYDLDYGDSLLERGVVAGIILTASGTLATAILARLHRPFAIERLPEQIQSITCICPMCQRKQSLAVGRPVACCSCGLRMEVRIAEPRCPKCEYLLYHLTSPRCPECGHDLGGPTGP